MRIAIFVLSALASVGVAQERLSFAQGRALSTQREAVLLVLVHGSDWQPFGERLMKAWAPQTLGEGVVCADVDILQTQDAALRKTNDERNQGWQKKGSGLRTYPAVLAYTPDGRAIGACQGHDLPRDPDSAHARLVKFASTCRTWLTLEGQLGAAREAKDAKQEVDLLVARDRLGLQRDPKLLDTLKQLDPKDRAGHIARLSLPPWNSLVQAATKEASGGKAADAEVRLQKLLAHPAYTAEQRASIHLALGNVYRRWQGHGEQAGASLEAAWQAAPESICGRAGQRLFLNFYSGPSLAFGWQDRHKQGEKSSWWLDDFPTKIEPGSYRLRLTLTRGRALPITGVSLLDGEELEVGHQTPIALSKAKPSTEFEFVVGDAIEKARLRIDLDATAATRGRLEWTKLR